jgi:D-alanyl-D-alanine dipeptidase
MTSKYYDRPIPVDPPFGDNDRGDFRDEALVAVEANDRIEIAMQYPLLGFDNGEPRCFLRQTAADMLQQAAKLLPEGLHFRVWDAWRPFALQEELFDKYTPRIVSHFHLEDRTAEEQKQFINQFVARPLADPALPPAHTTGGAIDLTIADDQGRDLDMGCAFDAFTDRTQAAWFETDAANEAENAQAIRANRRLLYNVMLEAGFTNLPSEWWHFDYGNRNWACVTGRPALYKGIFSLEK